LIAHSASTGAVIERIESGLLPVVFHQRFEAA
jgi:hypothetical protein